jgi:hypothetical protein
MLMVVVAALQDMLVCDAECRCFVGFRRHGCMQCAGACGFVVVRANLRVLANTLACVGCLIIRSVQVGQKVRGLLHTVSGASTDCSTALQLFCQVFPEIKLLL